MAHTLEYSTIFQAGLDKQIVAESTTGWMESNAGQVKYNGGNEIKIPSIVMDGLGDYDRAQGFVDGDVTMTYQTHTLTQDRGRTFSLDAMDVDETNFIATAGNVMGEFQRIQVVPEIDAYRYSKLATLAIGAGQTKAATITKADIVDAILDDLVKMEDAIGAKQVVITMSPILAGMLGKAGKDYISKAMLRKGEISIEVNAFNDNPIVKAPSKLLRTKITLQDGTTGGQEAGGFVKDGTGKDINWLISTKDAPIAISKTDVVRVFNPMENQKANAWKMDYRKYHDLWVPESKLPCIFVNTSV